VYWRSQCSRKRVQQLKKRRKSCFLYFEKKRKNVKKHVQFHRPLTHCGLNTQLPKVSTGKSHQHQTSCSEMRTQETVQLRTVINAYIPITTMNFEAKISIDTFSASLIRLCNNVSVIIQSNF